MPNRVYYHPGNGGEPICLDGGGAHIGVGGGLRSHEWTHELSVKSVRGLTLGARKVNVTAVMDDAIADRFRRMADADAAAKTPGTLEVDGTWSLKCYIVKSELTETYAGAVGLKMVVAAVDSTWRRAKSRHFVTGLDASGLDHEYDFEYDMSHSVGSGTIQVDSPQGAPAKITFYGPCTNPYITIGGNRYQVNESINSGYTVVIDATGPRPTVQKIDSFGNAANVFSSAVREGGLGGGSYAFEPLKDGVSTVGWSGAFSFDIEWYELDTEPPWTD